MPEGTAPAAPAAPPSPSGGDARPSLDQRVAGLTERLMAEEGESSSESAADAMAPPATPSADGGSSAADSGGDDAAKRAADRLARIAKVREREQRDAARRRDNEQRRAQEQASTTELNQLRQRLAQLEPLNNVFASEEALLEAAEGRGMSSQKIVEWMRKRLSDPAAIAQQRARSEADQVRAELAQLRDEFTRREQEWTQQVEQARSEREAIQRGQRFVHLAGTSQEHPHTQAFLKRHGAEGLVAWTNHFVAPLMSEGYNVEELHDHTEQLLEELQSGGAAAIKATPANGTSQSPKNGAGQPATTLSNALAGERSTVEAAVPLHKMSLDERVAFLRDKYSRE